MSTSTRCAPSGMPPSRLTAAGSSISRASTPARARCSGVLPLVIGGHTPVGYRRAIARGHGWYAYGLTPERAAECVAGLKAAADRVQRPDRRSGDDCDVSEGRAATSVHGRHGSLYGIHSVCWWSAKARLTAAVRLD